MTLLLRFLPHGIIAIAAFALGSWLTNTRAEADYQKLDNEFLTYRLDSEEAAKKAADAALADQNKQIEQNQEIERASQERAKVDALLIADLRARHERVRIPARCPPARSVPEDNRPAVPGGSSGDGGGPIEIDGRPFIEFAARTKAMKRQYEDCRAKLLSLQ